MQARTPKRPSIRWLNQNSKAPAAVQALLQKSDRILHWGHESYLSPYRTTTYKSIWEAVRPRAAALGQPVLLQKLARPAKDSR